MEAKAAVTYEFQKVYSNVMADMKTKFDNDDMTSEQKTEATNLINAAQEKLGTDSFDVLGLDKGRNTSREVFAVLAELKESGNMTSEQEEAIQDLAEDTQVRMIQGIVNVFNYTVEEAAGKYNMTVEGMAALLQRPTFASQEEEEESDAGLVDLLVGEPLDYMSISTEDSLIMDLETLTTFHQHDQDDHNLATTNTSNKGRSFHGMTQIAVAHISNPQLSFRCLVRLVFRGERQLPPCGLQQWSWSYDAPLLPGEEGAVLYCTVQ